MFDLDLDILNLHPEWRCLLLAYSQPIAEMSAADGELAELMARGFRPRLREVDGVPPDQLVRMHGKLIAHGFLQVEIANRTGGMLYQLTTSGRQACLRLAESVEDETLQLASA